MWLSRIAILTASTLALASATVTAQETNKQERKGFWIGLGAGAGFLGDQDFSNWEGAISGRFMIGGSLSQNVKIGYEGNSWVKSSFGLTTLVSMGGLTLHLYPSATQGLHGILGGGLSVIWVESVNSKTGGAAFGGVGYDVRVGHSISVTPYGILNAGFFQGGRIYLISLGASVTFH